MWAAGRALGCDADVMEELATISAGAISNELHMSVTRMRKELDLVVIRNLPKLIARVKEMVCLGRDSVGEMGGKWGKSWAVFTNVFGKSGKCCAKMPNKATFGWAGGRRAGGIRRKGGGQWGKQGDGTAALQAEWDVHWTPPAIGWEGRAQASPLQCAVASPSACHVM